MSQTIRSTQMINALFIQKYVYASDQRPVVVKLGLFLLNLLVIMANVCLS